MKKKLSVIMLLLLPIFIFAFLSNKSYQKINKTASAEPTTSDNVIMGEVKLSYMAESLDDLISNSSFIIEGVPTETQNEIIYQGVPFITTNIIIKKVLKGNLNAKEITLLQTKIIEDPLVKKGDHVLLYLEKYDGPIIKDAYVCKGLYQGNYNINNGIIINSIDLKSHNPKLSDGLKKDNTLEGLQNKIKSKGL